MNKTLDVVILIALLAFAVFTGYMLSAAWGHFMLCIAASLGVWELVASLRTEKTLTQKFRKIRENHPVRAWAFIIAINAFILYLNYHLLAGRGG